MPNLVANKDKKQTQYKIVVGGAPQVNTGVKNNKSASQNARENARGVDLRASSPQTARTNTQAKNVITSAAAPGTAHAPQSSVQTPVLNAAQQRYIPVRSGVCFPWSAPGNTITILGVLQVTSSPSFVKPLRDSL